MEIVDQVRKAVVRNAQMLAQARAVDEQARRGAAAEIESINTKLAGMTPGAVSLSPAKTAEYLSLVYRRGQLHEHVGG